MKRIRSIDDLKTVASTTNHILTLFSGGLDSTYLLEILSKYPVKITALAVDMGDGIEKEQLETITSHYGVDLIIVDAQQRFVDTAIIPAIQAQAKYLNMYPVSSSLSRPVIASYALEYAEKLNCGAIVHTANQSQNSLRRLNGSIKSSGFNGYYGTPYEYSAITREQKTKVLALSGLSEFKERNISGDSNLWCRKYESGVLDNPENFTVPEDLFQWFAYNKSKQVEHLNDQISISFKAGVPTAINYIPMTLIELISHLNIVIGAYQVGRYVGLEHLDEGEKVLEVREAPAATALMDTYKYLETAVHDAELMREKNILEQIWTREAVEGKWGSPLHGAARQFIRSTTEKVTGTVTFYLRQGEMFPKSIMATDSLYLTDRDAWEVDVAKSRGMRELPPVTPQQILENVA